VADSALLEGVTAKSVNTPRLQTRLLAGGAEGGTPVFFVHGNTSSSRFFEETLATLPPEASYWGIAPDLRGFGDEAGGRHQRPRGLLQGPVRPRKRLGTKGPCGSPGGLVDRRHGSHALHYGPPAHSSLPDPR
jgi:pimeloyl-ACP methyl ester carboxylesterase